jgi:serine/threonine protein kinase
MESWSSNVTGATQTEMIGKIIGSQFRVIRKLGAGGMGSVYLAEQVDMDRQVVVKMMHPELTAGSSEAAERFKREARSVAKLNHPHIVQVYVFGQTDDLQLYLAMEFIDGHTLTSVIETKKGMAVPRALRILDQVCSALIEAHGTGLVHRDLKPDNIMLSNRHGNPDYVKVLDFGIAKMLGGDTGEQDLTKTGAAFGTPRYMSPEQAQGKSVDARSDLYALGVILYQMLTGEHPYQATSALAYIMKHVTEPIGAPSAKVGTDAIPPRVDAIVQQCVEKDPAKRFQSAADLQRALRTALRDFPESQRGYATPGLGNPLTHGAMPPPPPSAADTLNPPTRRSRPLWLWILIGALVLGGGSTGIYFAVRDGDSGRSARKSRPATTTKSDVSQKRRRKRKKKDAAKTATAATPKAEQPPALVSDVPIPKKGEPIEGLPVPVETRLMASTPQALVLTTELAPAEALAFYRHHMQKEWGALKDVPNGFQVTDPKAPITYVMVQRGPLGAMISLSRNALVEPPAESKPAQLVFGVPVYPGAKTSVRTPTTLGLVSADPLSKVITFYRQYFGLHEGVSLSHTNDGKGHPLLSVVSNQDTLEFRTVTVMADPQDPNGNRAAIYVQKR